MYEQSMERLRRLASQVPQAEKRAYMLSLSEDDFRDKIVRPLFKELGYTDGRDTCGPMEQGRDAYFTQESPLAGTEITVVQTKTGKITKSAKPSENLDSIVAQLRTAVSTPVLLVATKQKKRPLRGFLVSSGEIKPAAVTYIVDELREASLSFLDSEALVPLIDDKMPALWLNISSDVMPYFRAIATALEEGQDILPGGYNVAPGSRQVASSADLFVDVLMFRPTKPALANARKTKRSSTPRLEYLRVTTIIDVPQRLVLVVGEAGSGKTTALKRIVYEQATKPIEHHEAIRIPILMRAKDLAADKPPSLLDYVDTIVKALSPELRIPFSADDLAAGRVVLMIDGLDEVTDDVATTRIVTLIEEHNAKYPKTQIIVGTRNTPFVNATIRFNSFTRFQLSALAGAQIEKLVHGYAKRHSLGTDYSTEVLRRLDEIHGVELNPLMVTIFVATSDSARGDFPANVTELFNKYTELMLGRWDESKGFQQQIQAPIKDFILRQIALKMHERGETSIALADFRSTLTDELARRGFGEDSETLFDEITYRSGLFRTDNARLEFKHLILQEYFAGRAIPNTDYIIARLGKAWWRNAIVFYFGGNPGDVSTLKRLADMLPHQSGTERLVSSAAVGLGLQACYLSEIEDKHDVYRKLLFNLADDATTTGAYGGYFDDFPIVKSITYMFLIRDSLSLSTLRLFAKELYSEVLQLIETRPAEGERALFWLILGLIESNQPELAVDYVLKFRPKDGTLLFSLMIDAMMILNSRAMSSGTAKELRAFFDDTAQRLSKKYPEVAPSLRKERTELEARGAKALATDAGAATPEDDEDFSSDFEVDENNRPADA